MLNKRDSLGETVKAAWRELKERRMVNTDFDSINMMMPDSGMTADVMAPQGARFLQFVGGASEMEFDWAMEKRVVAQKWRFGMAPAKPSTTRDLMRAWETVLGEPSLARRRLDGAN